ncbi:MAG: hypothetical protein A2802_01945 [Candidatus Woykebacteria bacterium RIFCSPHIGHO2_01_FULL_43_29]|uniref:Uncharacterized protein n=2 Tax=Candidatus Woykeibacteriota TaxID=1817899 RepID=A0A1G1WXK4_9BACT|nr:MAG: hypothetical protein A2802_01945 [Candidatus Woykebacteria bacterium RIFCSPHIGHO2_01_FULL_43_29]OGY31877.1 MAG: hypothetical protein A3A61_03120 [Candidatus Woykebacteria bacterium RIFCSPLOWO2_01_FULL_43_14]
MSDSVPKRRVSVMPKYQGQIANLLTAVVRLMNYISGATIEEATLEGSADPDNVVNITFGKKLPIGRLPWVSLGGGGTTVSFKGVTCVTTPTGEFARLVLSGVKIEWLPKMVITQVSGKNPEWVISQVMHVHLKELVIPSLDGHTAWVNIYVDPAASCMLRLEFEFPLLAPTAA